SSYNAAIPHDPESISKLGQCAHAHRAVKWWACLAERISGTAPARTRMDSAISKRLSPAAVLSVHVSTLARCDRRQPSYRGRDSALVSWPEILPAGKWHRSVAISHSRSLV